jgi:hypothetical protein
MVLSFKLGGKRRHGCDYESRGCRRAAKQQFAAHLIDVALRAIREDRLALARMGGTRRSLAKALLATWAVISAGVRIRRA